MYIGNDLQIAHPSYKIIDDISSGFNGSATSFALQVSGATPVPFPISTQQVMISVNGVVQEPDPNGSAGFKLLGSNIVFSSAPANGHAFFGVINAGADYVTAGSEFPDGSATAPSFTFQDDQDTGWFRSGSGAVGFSANGVNTIGFDGNGLTVTGDATFTGDSSKNLFWDKSDGQLEFADNAKAVFGTGSDLTIYHNGTNSIVGDTGAGELSLQTNGTGIRLWNSADGETLLNALNNGAVELYHNNVKQLETTSIGISTPGYLYLTGDGKEIRMGASGDFRLFHDGSHNRIDSTNGNIYLRHGTDNAIKTVPNGTVELYFDDAKKFETSTTGATLTGNLAINNSTQSKIVLDTSDGSDNKWLNINGGGDASQSRGGGIMFGGNEYSGHEGRVWILAGNSGNTNGTIDFSTAGSIRASITNDGHFKIPNDSGRIKLGTGADLQIYHDGTNSYLDNNTNSIYIRTNVDGDDGGNIYIEAKSGETSIECADDSFVALYYDGSKKIETTSTGIDVTGAIQVNGAALSTAPTFTATASGAITAADKALILKTDGKVEQIVETVINAATGSVVNAPSSGQTKDGVKVCSIGTNRFLAVWKVINDNNKLYGAVATVTGTTIVYGNQIRIHNHIATNEYDICYDSSLDVGYICFSEGGTGNMHGIGLTFSGTGSSGTFAQNSTKWTNGGTAVSMRCVSDQKGGIFMTYAGGGSQPKVRCATIASNGAVTPGSEASTTGSMYSHKNSLSLAYDSKADRVGWAMNNTGQDTKGGIISRSGTLATFAGGASLQGQTHYHGIRIVYDTKNDHFLLIFRTYASSSTATEGTTWYTNAAGNGFTVGTAKFSLHANRFDASAADFSETLEKAFFFFQNDSAGNTSMLTMTGTGGQGGTYSTTITTTYNHNDSQVGGCCLSNGKICASQQDSSQQMATVVLQIGYTATNLESDNFIGFSADSYSDGATATVKIDSNTTTQSSLTPVKTYYIQRDGTLGTAAATPSVLGGIALSSTKLLIDAHR
jgi:hypothetical protein